MSLKPKLIAAYFTLAGDVLPLAGTMISPRPFADRAQAAARAGYAGIGLHTDDLAASIERYGIAGIKHILDDCGLKYFEIEALLDWFVDGERRRSSDVVRTFMLDAAERLGAFQIKVAGDLFGGDWPVQKMTQEFAVLCRQAADVGANVSIEILPFSNIRDLGTGVEIVAGAGQANGGLLLDIWHMARGGIPFDDIAAVPAAYLKHMEIDDADETVSGSLLEDTIRNRRLPGEGSFDVPHFLRSVKATGYSGMYGVEVVSDANRALDLDQAAQRSYEATMKQFERVDDRT
jgi:sugar phosphate isomerase/epimerase